MKSSSGKPAPPQLPPPRGDLKFRFPKYRVESSTRPSHAAGICSDVTEYILPEETSNKNYSRAWEASNTCHTSSRYYPLTIPGAICSPPPTPPPPPSTPLPRRWVEPGVGQELNGRVDQPQQSRVMRPKAARLPRSIPMMPTREEAVGIPGTALPVPPNSPRAAAGYTVSTDTVIAGTSVAQTVEEIFTPTTTIITAVLSGIRVARNRRTGDAQIMGSKASQKATVDPAPKTGARVRGAQTGGNKATPTLAVEISAIPETKGTQAGATGTIPRRKSTGTLIGARVGNPPDNGENSLFGFNWK